jgi:iron-sulfur cluster assembly accessory protein
MMEGIDAKSTGWFGLTERAAGELALMLKARGAGVDEGLRLAVSRGGCAGWQYVMRIARAEPGDVVVAQAGARVFVAADSVAKLRGCEIDFSDDLTDAGFKVHNPQAARSCGCGTSFETSEEPAGPEQTGGSDEVSGEGVAGSGDCRNPTKG